MTNTYAIEFEASDADQTKFGHTMVVAPTAHEAVEEFCRNHPSADIRELRKVHGS